MSHIKLEKNGPIAYVKLDRVEKRNAISFDMLNQLVKVAKEIKKDKSIRVVILSGEGDAFSSGIDLGDLNNPKNSAYAFWELLKPGQSLFQKANLIWQTLPVPVIAVLHGYCFGAGIQLALAADMRITTPDCKIAIMEGKWGLVPDMGLTRSLKDIIPLDLAKELTLTARVFSGEYAKEIGLVTHVSDDPMTMAQQLAEELIQRSPDSLLAGKRVLDAMAHQPSRALRLEKIWQLKLLLGKNSRIARARAKKPETPYNPRQFG